jgi:hypothetical protein
MIDQGDNENKLYEAALRIAIETTNMLKRGDLDQIHGALHVADSWLQFIIVDERDSDAELARKKSLDNPADRPMFRQALQLTGQGMNALKQNQPKFAEAALEIANLYRKIAENWEPAANDDVIRNEFQQLRGLIKRQGEQVKMLSLAPKKQTE